MPHSDTPPGKAHRQLQEDIENLRGKVDVLDQAILDLLAQRMALVRDIGSKKLSLGLPAYQSNRLTWLLENRCQMAAQLNLPSGFITDLYTRIHQESLQVQNQLTMPNQQATRSRTDIELMAPAGSRDSLMAAIKAGADSVYFGVEQLNMRARSTMNFTLHDLEDVAAIGREHGIKTYITLNTILYDHDLRLMKNIVEKAKTAGISAIIAADHAAIMYAHQQGMDVHISTQANITNVETVAFYAHFANTVVLSRELSLMQVKQITKEIARRKIIGPGGQLVQVEVFAHGALCMAVSGKCYLSLHTHNASANRGACVQNCRRAYVVTDKEEGHELEIDNEYIMSAKDLNTIGFLDKVLDAGVRVLKIEGRGRSPEYVFTTTQCYREAIDSVSNGTFSQEKVSAWNARLETVFNRGFWDGYYLGKTLGEWNDSYGSKASHRKWHLGKGIKYFDKLGVGEFEMESGELQVGDEIVINGPTTGVVYHKVAELRVDGKPVDKVLKGDLFSMPIPEKVRPSDKLFKWQKA